VRREVLEGDRPADDRRSDRQVVGDRIVERDEPVADHVREQQAREGLGDRADLEHRVGGHAAAPEARLSAPAQPDRDPLQAGFHARQAVWSRFAYTVYG
jgi:hypothetical protein